MYRKEIEQYIEKHKEEMVEDIFTLCRIDSQKMPYEKGMPYGKGPSMALSTALSMAEGYGFSVCNYDDYVGTVDLNDKEKHGGQSLIHQLAVCFSFYFRHKDFHDFTFIGWRWMFDF